MKVWGIQESTIRSIIATLNEHHYGNNIEIKNGAFKWVGKALQFDLKMRDSRGAGAMKSASGRRTIRPNWYVYRDVITALFNANPDARVQTSIADYRGADDFFEKYPRTYHLNKGSAMHPVKLGSL